MNTAHLLSSSFTPIVLISACGLITPSLYSRLGEILSRIRLIHHQKIELLRNLHEHEIEEQEMLLAMLDSQIEHVTDKGKDCQAKPVLFAVRYRLFLVLFGIRRSFSIERVGRHRSLGNGNSWDIPVSCRSGMGNAGTLAISDAIAGRK